MLLQAKTKLFIFKEIIFIVLGHFPCLLLLGFPVDVNSEHIAWCALVGLSAVLRRSQRVHFSLLVEHFSLLVMLYGEVISFEWGS